MAVHKPGTLGTPDGDATFTKCACSRDVRQGLQVCCPHQRWRLVCHWTLHCARKLEPANSMSRAARPACTVAVSCAKTSACTLPVRHTLGRFATVPGQPAWTLQAATGRSQFGKVTKIMRASCPRYAHITQSITARKPKPPLTYCTCGGLLLRKATRQKRSHGAGAGTKRSVKADFAVKRTSETRASDLQLPQ